MSKLKKIFFNGLSVTLPAILIIFLTKEALSYIHDLIVAPIERFLPKETFMGIEYTNFIAFGIFLIIIILSGLFLNTKSGVKLVKRLGEIIPGYNLLRSIFSDGEELNESKLKVCLAKPDESWQYGFIIEEHLSGLLTVYIPDAPNFTGGAVFFLKEEQVKRLDISAKDAAKNIMKLGYGSKDLLDKYFKL